MAKYGIISQNYPVIEIVPERFSSIESIVVTQAADNNNYEVLDSSKYDVRWGYTNEIHSKKTLIITFNMLQQDFLKLCHKFDLLIFKGKPHFINSRKYPIRQLWKIKMEGISFICRDNQEIIKASYPDIEIKLKRMPKNIQDFYIRSYSIDWKLPTLWYNYSIGESIKIHFNVPSYVLWDYFKKYTGGLLLLCCTTAYVKKKDASISERRHTWIYSLMYQFCNGKNINYGKYERNDYQ